MLDRKFYSIIDKTEDFNGVYDVRTRTLNFNKIRIQTLKYKITLVIFKGLTTNPFIERHFKVLKSTKLEKYNSPLVIQK